MSSGTRACTKCGKTKDLSLFNKDRRRADGTTGVCKECRRSVYAERAEIVCEQTKRRYWESREQEIQRMRDRYEKNAEAERLRSQSRKHSPREYDRDRARIKNAVTQAILCGKLLKRPCVICGATDRVQGHHEDYSRPLDVIWLCAKHHARLHGDRRRGIMRTVIIDGGEAVIVDADNKLEG